MKLIQQYLRYLGRDHRLIDMSDLVLSSESFAGCQTLHSGFSTAIKRDCHEW